jgi:large subunit ribosomal protein L24
MNKIRKGDEVVVTAGREKGRRGTVIKVLANDRVLVENVNMVKRHTPPTRSAGPRAASSRRRPRCTSRT